MNRVALAAIALAAAGCVAALAACTSSEGGTGTPGPTSPARSSSSASSSTPPTTSAAPTPTRTASSAPTTTPTTTSASTSSSSSSSSSSSGGSSSGGAAQILNVTYSANCPPAPSTGPVPAGTVSLSWTSKNATEVWVLEGGVPSVLVYANAKTDGGTGPLSANGSRTMPFSCADVNDSYLVEAYGSDGSHSGTVETVSHP